MFSGAALVLGLLVKTSYAVRELMAVLVIIGAGFAALSLLFVFCFFASRTAVAIVFWVRMRSPLWNRVVNGWKSAFSQSQSGIAERWPWSFARTEEVFLNERTSILTASSTLPEEK